MVGRASSAPRRSKSGKARLIARPRIFIKHHVHETVLSNDQWAIAGFVGGRGSLKTTAIAMFFIEMSYFLRNCNLVVLREMAVTIDGSTYQDIKRVIEGMKPMSVYGCTIDGSPYPVSANDFEIKGKYFRNKRTNVRITFNKVRVTGGETSLSQLEALKGLNGKLFWLEEAARMSRQALDVLIPSIMRLGTVLQSGVTEEADEYSPRVFVAMNPLSAQDPIRAVIADYAELGTGIEVFANMTDLVGEPGDKEAGIIRNSSVLVNGKPHAIKTDPRFQDKALFAKKAADVNSFNYRHTWYGEMHESYAGAPWASHDYLHGVPDSDICVDMMWLDPADEGEDCTALCMSGYRYSDPEHRVFFGKLWRRGAGDTAVKAAVISLIKKWRPSNGLWYESNGVGAAVKQAYQDPNFNGRATVIGTGISLNAKATDVQKRAKIIMAGMLTHQAGCKILCTQSDVPWVNAVRDWTADTKKNDDAPDSIASLCYAAGIIKKQAILDLT